MEIINPEEFAIFLYNQTQKQKILSQDIEIQKDGLEHEVEQWHQVLSLYKEKGDKEKENVVVQEISSLRIEKENLTAASQHLNLISNVLDDLKALPEVKPQFHRIEAAKQNLTKWSLPE